MSTHATDASGVLEAFEEFRAAIEAKDRPALEDFHDPDFKATELHGKLMSAEEHITAIMAGGELELVLSDLTTMHLEEIAIVWGRQTLRGFLEPDALTQELSDAIQEGIYFALTAIWRKWPDDRWRLLTYHVSLIPDE